MKIELAGHTLKITGLDAEHQDPESEPGARVYDFPPRVPGMARLLVVTAQISPPAWHQWVEAMRGQGIADWFVVLHPGETLDVYQIPVPAEAVKEESPGMEANKP